MEKNPENICTVEEILAHKRSNLMSVVYSLIASIPLLTLVFIVSLAAPSYTLGQTLAEHPLDETLDDLGRNWDLSAIRGQGDRFLIESFAEDDPKRVRINRALEWGTLKLKLGDLSDAEILSLCDHREIKRINNQNIISCPHKLSSQSVFPTFKSPRELEAEFASSPPLMSPLSHPSAPGGLCRSSPIP